MNNPKQFTRRELLNAALNTGIVLALDARFSRSAESQMGSSPAFFDTAQSARPWVYWIWLNGNISAEGITADLEAMHDIGIGGAIILHLGSGKPGPIKFGSPEFQKIITHTLSESNRLGMQMDFNNDDGWDAAGPWVTPEHSMQKLVWTETPVQGPSHVSLQLAQPETSHNFYRDIAVFAVPAPLGSRDILPEPKITQTSGSPSIVLHDYGTPVTVRSADFNLSVTSAVLDVPIVFNLECSDDGMNFRTVYHFDNRWRFRALRNNRSVNFSVRFSATRARYFRIVLPFTTTLAPIMDRNGKASANFQNRFRLSAEDRIAFWEKKGGHAGIGPIEKPDRYPNGWQDALKEDNGLVPPPADEKSVIPRSSIIHLTSASNSGHLEWTCPPGEWMIVRLGHTTTGARNTVASADGRGLEIDYLSKTGLDNHFPEFLGVIASRNAGLIGKGLTAFHSDSWEGGAQNWTSDFATEFESRRGYSMSNYLPVLTGGRIVGSLEESERFLWDFRLTIADLIAENFWGHLTKLCHQRGILCTNEGAGFGQFMEDPLRYMSKADMTMGEFWVQESDLRPDCHLASSVGNTYGKPLVGGEAFTSTTTSTDPQAGQWMDHPYSLKAYGDRAFCIGINRFVFHRSVHQPDLHAKPGLAWPKVGINMERTNTWWKPGAAWISYLTRCQHLLQSGRMVADICVLVRQGVPNILIRPEGLPPGYRYDGLHTELLQKATVERGEIVLPSGMRYRIMVLPSETTMTPEVATEVGRLLRAGAVMVGQRPTASPSLHNYRQCDKQVSQIVSAWPKLFDTIAGALQHLSLTPDFFCVDNPESSDVLYLHRKDNDKDIYFVSNQEYTTRQMRAFFRIADKAPLILDPDSGEIIEVASYSSDHRGTVIPITLPPAGSFFVIFERKNMREALAALPANTECRFTPKGELEITALASGIMKLRSTHGRNAGLQLAQLPAETLIAPWNVSFPLETGAPAIVKLHNLISWSEHENSSIRHFSGTAMYTASFSIEASEIQPSLAFFLDLGEVQVIAEVIMNGQSLGTRWKPPFRYDITEKLKSGVNNLTIAVTNLWPNRLIGDAALPEDKRVTKTNYNPYKPDAPLLPSGLLGPVKVIVAHRRIVRWNQ